ncbi:zinc finger protein 346-like [Stegodyphus dumicola]|uniref:zinc finger protein 346-like n=1 Tax=Stegodyphus dumicola TaxID=202533 RepID=UPI0015AEEDB1|nr:zinc finger protein 346-like [Stegodyphus dumicola]
MDAGKEKKRDCIISDSDDSSCIDIECDLCGTLFESVKSYEQHLKSKKHNKMLNKNKLKKELKKPDELVDEANNKDDDDQDSEIHCSVCGKAFNDLSQYKSHLKGGVHSKNLKKQKLKEKLKDMDGIIDGNVENEGDDDGVLEKPYAYCAACQKHFSGPESYQRHLKGTTHEKKLKHQAILEKFKKDNPDDAKLVDDEDDGYLKCDVCSKFFSGHVPYSIHVESAVHKKEVKRRKVAEDLKDFYIRDAENAKFVCKECKRPFSDILALKIHLEVNDHEKQKSKREIMNLLSSHSEIVPVKCLENSVSDDEGEIDGDAKQDYDFLVCNICRLSFSGPASARDHVKSKKHLRMKKEKEDMKALKNKLKIMRPNYENENTSRDKHSDDTAMISNSKADTADDALDTSKQDGFEFI